MNEPGMLLSGEDSGLANVWDEICVQRQVEESFAWEAYEQTAHALIDGKLSEISQRWLSALWLLTENGGDWTNEHFDDGAQPEPYLPDVASYVFDELMNAAEDHTNPRIRAYRDRSYLD